MCVWCVLEALATEPLAVSIRYSTLIKGTQTNNNKWKLSHFADDLALYLTDHLDSIAYLQVVVDSFVQVSGLSINHQKCVFYPNNLSKGLISTPKVSYLLEGKFLCWNFLGLKILLHLTLLFKYNLSFLYQNLQSQIKDWEKLNLTRYDLIKSFIFPKCMYYFMMLAINIPCQCFKNWQSTLNKFLWSGKKVRIYFEVLFSPSLHGGFTYLDLKTYY